jgi:hypothetical protein
MGETMYYGDVEDGSNKNRQPTTGEKRIPGKRYSPKMQLRFIILFIIIDI